MSRFYLGWPTTKEKPSIGFHVTAEVYPEPKRNDLRDALAYRGDAHYLCIAPTGAGKTRSVVITNLLAIRCSCVVLDIKGELCNVTAGWRKRFGPVHVFDPFGLTKYPRASLNPLDLFKLTRCDLESDVHMLANNLSDGFAFSQEPFWSVMGNLLNGGIISYLAGADDDIRNLNSLVNYLFADDIAYGLAMLLDSGKVTNKAAHQAIAATIQLPEKTRECVIATAQSYVTSLQSPGIQEALAQSSFNLAQFAGEPTTIYFCFPPTKLRSHAPLLRLWLGTLLTALCGRDVNPKEPIWFFIDEAAQLGHWEQLEQVLTLLRGYGIQTATFWQDISQLRSNYPLSWPTIISNSAAIQAFGISKWQTAKELADVFGNRPEDFLRLQPHESLVMNDGELQVCRKLDYLRDPVFAGQYRPNPRFRCRKDHVIGA